jgi:DNA polymerase III epsilon subunit-like protein
MLNNWVVVDVEADGPYPGDYSMVSFGAVSVTNHTKAYYGTVAPISNNYDERALSISHTTRKEHLTYRHPTSVIPDFVKWVERNFSDPIVFVSDNLAFDWQWINYYCHKYAGRNPFGFSGRRIGDLICGAHGDLKFRWKHKRITKHDHNPVNDAKGNAEALLHYVTPEGKFLLDSTAR